MTKTLDEKDLRIRGDWANVSKQAQDLLAGRFGAHHATSIVWLWGLSGRPVKNPDADQLEDLARKAIAANRKLLQHAPGLDKALGVDNHDATD